MAVAAYALTSVEKVVSFMGAALVDESLFGVNHQATGGATAATVAVSTGQLTLIVTGGVYAGTYNLDFATYSTVDLLVAAINGLGKGFLADTLLGKGDVPTAGLTNSAVLDCYGYAARQYMEGQNTLEVERAVNAATAMIERRCGNRRFAETQYQHLLSGGGRRMMRLPHTPVTQITRVAISTGAVIRVKNTSTDNAFATVSNDGTNLTLHIEGGANDGDDTVAIGANTMTSLVTAIVAVGKGWTAQLVSSEYGTWIADTLLEFEARDCTRQYLDLLALEEPIESYDIDPDAGMLWRAPISGITSTAGPLLYGGGAMTPVELRPLTPAKVGPVWPPGVHNIYVEYKAGFATIPADVENVATRLAANILRGSKRDTALRSESAEGYSYSASDEGPFTKAMQGELLPYKYMLPPRFIEV